MEEINRKLRAELENLRREHERAGRERALLRCILDSASDLIFVKDQHGVYRGCNRASEQFLGLKESDQIGKTDYDFFDAEVADGIRADDRQVMETNQPVHREEWVTYADGHKALMDTVKVPYRGPDGEPLGLVGIARDITERIRAERALKESETKYVDLYENAPDMYASVNAQTILIEECNMTLANTLGVAKAEIIGRPVFDIYHPDCLNEVKETFQQFVKTGTVHDKELQLIRKDGSKLDVSLNASAVRGDDGRILFSRSTLRDITEQKRMEAELAQYREHLEEQVNARTAELESANKELEAFAYSVSHDLRAPLRHIEGFMALLQNRVEANLDEQGRQYMDAISEAAQKMARLIDNLLSFSRTGRQAMSLHPVKLDFLIGDVIRELEPDASQRNISWQIGDLPLIHGDASMLRMVLTNLIANALKFTRPREQAEIHIGCTSGNDGETVIFVRDNGVGFDMTYVDRLFGVFQRLHRADEFEGTGIGLATVRRIIARHGGRTWAEGTPDRGATFYFALPQPSRKKGNENETIR